MADVAGISLSNTAQRVITGVVVAPLVVLTVFAGGIAFTMVVLLVAIVGVTEFYLLARNRLSQGSTLIGVPMLIVTVLAFHFREPLLLAGGLALGVVLTFILELARHRDARRSLFQVGMTLAGTLYLAFPAGFLISLRAQPTVNASINDGVLWILLILCVTWGTDSFAYIGGRLWGKTKLAPKLSPKKTREGAAVGVIGGIVPALILLALTSSFSTAALVFIVLGPFVAVLGDLFESAIKRFFDVKDSHIDGLDLLPGHGGILDRIDSLLLVAGFAYLVINLFGVTGV
ncbi:MAG: phosphatidate cytidylyltransferase [Chloroflexota bacterium]